MKFLSVAIVSLLALAVSAKQCSKSQFGYSSPRTGNCCLHKGGSPDHPSPPNDKECPDDWQWHDGYRVCVPTHSDHSSNPHCRHGIWSDDDECCHKPTRPGHPRPSHVYGYGNLWKKRVDAKIMARNWRSKTLSCTAGQTVCNVSDSITSSTWACVDTQKDVNFCGGCGINGAVGQDCTTIPNSWNVACVSGGCKVLTCEAGFRVSRNGQSCVALE